MGLLSIFRRGHARDSAPLKPPNKSDAMQSWDPLIFSEEEVRGVVQELWSDASRQACRSFQIEDPSIHELPEELEDRMSCGTHVHHDMLVEDATIVPTRLQEPQPECAAIFRLGLKLLASRAVQYEIAYAIASEPDLLQIFQSCRLTAHLGSLPNQSRQLENTALQETDDFHSPDEVLVASVAAAAVASHHLADMMASIDEDDDDGDLHDLRFVQACDDGHANLTSQARKVSDSGHNRSHGHVTSSANGDSQTCSGGGGSQGNNVQTSIPCSSEDYDTTVGGQTGGSCDCGAGNNAGAGYDGTQDDLLLHHHQFEATGEVEVPHSFSWLVKGLGRVLHIGGRPLELLGRSLGRIGGRVLPHPKSFAGAGAAPVSVAQNGVPAGACALDRQGSVGLRGGTMNERENTLIARGATVNVREKTVNYRETVVGDIIVGGRENFVHGREISAGERESTVDDRIAGDEQAAEATADQQEGIVSRMERKGAGNKVEDNVRQGEAFRNQQQAVRGEKRFIAPAAQALDPRTAQPSAYMDSHPDPVAASPAPINVHHAYMQDEKRTSPRRHQPGHLHEGDQPRHSDKIYPASCSDDNDSPRHSSESYPPFYSDSRQHPHTGSGENRNPRRFEYNNSGTTRAPRPTGHHSTAWPTSLGGINIPLASDPSKSLHGNLVLGARQANILHGAVMVAVAISCVLLARNPTRAALLTRMAAANSDNHNGTAGSNSTPDSKGSSGYSSTSATGSSRANARGPPTNTRTSSTAYARTSYGQAGTSEAGPGTSSLPASAVGAAVDTGPVHGQRGVVATADHQRPSAAPNLNNFPATDFAACDSVTGDSRGEFVPVFGAGGVAAVPTSGIDGAASKASSSMLDAVGAEWQRLKGGLFGGGSCA